MKLFASVRLFIAVQVALTSLLIASWILLSPPTQQFVAMLTLLFSITYSVLWLSVRHRRSTELLVAKREKSARQQQQILEQLIHKTNVETQNLLTTRSEKMISLIDLNTEEMRHAFKFFQAKNPDQRDLRAIDDITIIRDQMDQIRNALLGTDLESTVKQPGQYE